MLAKLIYANWQDMSREQRFNVSMGEVINDPKLYRVVSVLNVNADTPIDACDNISECFNIGDHGGQKVRSTSVGDIVLFLDGTIGDVASFPNGDAFLCQGAGWKKLHEAYDGFLSKIS